MKVMGPMYQENIIDSGKCGENVTWTLDDTGILTISGTGPMEDFIYAPWQDLRDKIIHAEIQSGVTYIGEGAFEGLGILKSISVPDGVEKIGKYAFFCCDSLTAMTIPNSVTSISVGAFADCISLTSVTIGDGVTSIDKGAFFSCGDLTDVTIGNGIISIGEDAFGFCAVKNVYYSGTAEQWNAIDIGPGNDGLADCHKIFLEG